jgi:chromosome partitioning protein
MVFRWTISSAYNALSELATALKAIGKVAHPSISMRVDNQDALAVGLGVTEYAPKGKAAREMTELWNWIRDAVEKEEQSMSKGIAR